MYLVSLYFDEKTNNRIQQYIDKVARMTGNVFMLEGKVPPHITISAFETRQEEMAIQCLQEKVTELRAGTIQWVSVGAFLPHVIYLSPVLNEYLHKLSVEIYDSLSYMKETKISPYYRPFQWLPHTTIGKKLSEEELRIAFEVLQNQFGVFKGKVTHIGLARTNPYEDLILCELK